MGLKRQLGVGYKTARSLNQNLVQTTPSAPNSGWTCWGFRLSLIDHQFRFVLCVPGFTDSPRRSAIHTGVGLCTVRILSLGRLVARCYPTVDDHLTRVCPTNFAGRKHIWLQAH